MTYFGVNIYHALMQRDVNNSNVSSDCFDKSVNILNQETKNEKNQMKTLIVILTWNNKVAPIREISANNNSNIQ